MKPERTRVMSAVVGRAGLIPRHLSPDEQERVRALLDNPSVETCRRALGIEVAPGLRLWRAITEANPTWRLESKQVPSQLAVARALRYARRWPRGSAS